jgi:hypothetical protein
LVQATGGYSVIVPANRAERLPEIIKTTTTSDSDLARLTRQVKLISTFERLELELPGPLHKAESWDLKIVGITGPALTAEFPHLLAPCPAN